MAWLQQNRSVETEHLYMRALQQFYAYAAQSTDQVDAFRLGQYIEKYRRPKVHTIPTLPFEAINRIVQYAESGISIHATASERELLGQLRDRAFILILAYTGLRISEICDLRRQHIRLDAGYLEYIADAQLPLPAVAVSALHGYLSTRQPIETRQRQYESPQVPLFARHDKRAGSRILPISRWTGANIVEAWVQAALLPEEQQQLLQAGQTITPHTFRHHFVLNALMNSNHDIAAIQTLARHEDRSTTRRYFNKLRRDANPQP